MDGRIRIWHAPIALATLPKVIDWNW